MSMLANELGWDQHRSEQVLVCVVRFPFYCFERLSFFSLIHVVLKDIL